MLVSKTIIRTYTSPHIYNAPHVQRALALVEFVCVYALVFILSLLVVLEELCRTIHTMNKNMLSNLLRWQFPFYLCELIFF